MSSQLKYQTKLVGDTLSTLQVGSSWSVGWSICCVIHTDAPCTHTLMHRRPIHPYAHAPIHTIHPYTHTPIPPYTRAPIHPYTHTPIHPYTHTPIPHTPVPIHSYTHTLIRPCRHTLVDSGGGPAVGEHWTSSQRPRPRWVENSHPGVGFGCMVLSGGLAGFVGVSVRV